MTMDSPRIQDIPSIKKTLDDAKKLKSAFANLDELECQAKELATLPDRFNEATGTHRTMA
jgi:hypothetical protein